MGKFFPKSSKNVPASPVADLLRIGRFTYGGATRSRTGLNGFAIRQALCAKQPTPGALVRMGRLNRLFRAGLSKFFPVLLALAALSFTATAQPVRLIAIGDSITQGGRAGTKEYTYRWPLARMLRDEGACVDFIGSRRAGLDPAAKWPEAWDDDHEGYYGASAAFVRDQLAKNLPNLPPPDVALIHLGTNDMSGSIDRDVIAPMRDIVGILRKSNPRVRVLIGQIPAGVVRGVYLHYRVSELADAMTTPASQVRAVDQYIGWSAKAHTFDGVHPNLAGQRWMAERWLLALASSFQHLGANRVPCNLAELAVIGQRRDLARGNPPTTSGIRIPGGQRWVLVNGDP